MQKAIRGRILISRLATVLLLLFLVTVLKAGSLENFLKTLPVSDIRLLETEAFYTDIYEILFEQPVDHRHPEKGTFSQRLYVSHLDPSLPVVFSTEGYSADYYYTTELASLLKCNQIIAEHRFFGQSVPDSLDYEYLDTWQSATDHHRIIEAFKAYFSGDWITTGISKGGQSVIFHSYYYPEDVDVRVPYVAPLNNCIEDLRIYEFLENVGPRKCRKRIRRFQEMALQRQDDIIPVFKEFSNNKGYTYKMVGGVEKAYEYCVLEYSFAFWQWGYSSCGDIPSKRATPKEIIYHMNKVSGFDYFADKFVRIYQPFFYQAYTEMGYYGYELEEFEPYLQHVTERGFEFALPGDEEVVFDDSLLGKVRDYISNEAENFVFIYGEWDTWSASAVTLSEKTNSRLFVKKEGSHRTRIRNMPEDQQNKIMQVLNDFLDGP